MKTYYAVATTIFDDGRIACNIVDDTEAENRPSNKSTSTTQADYYIDWFDNLEEARDFVKQSKNA